MKSHRGNFREEVQIFFFSRIPVKLINTSEPLSPTLTPAAGYCSFFLPLCWRTVPHGPVTGWTAEGSVCCGATAAQPNHRLSDSRGLHDQTQLATWLISLEGGACFDDPAIKEKQQNMEKIKKKQLRGKILLQYNKISWVHLRHSCKFNSIKV